jgi:hypothetical protein
VFRQEVVHRRTAAVEHAVVVARPAAVEGLAGIERNLLCSAGPAPANPGRRRAAPPAGSPNSQPHPQ